MPRPAPTHWRRDCVRRRDWPIAARSRPHPGRPGPPSCRARAFGGFAAQQHGAIRPTDDIDITPATDADNLAGLATALRELDARIRVADVPAGLPFDTSAEALRGVSMLNLRCPYGDFDISFTPAGTDGYSDLVHSAISHTLDGVTVKIASLDDIIRSKTAAGRPKDALALPELERLANPKRTERSLG